MSTRDFFFYGTLRDQDVRALVLGALSPRMMIPATVAGWRRAAVADATFPVAVAAPNATIDGVIARGLTPAAVALLVRYEGPEYDIVQVTARLPDGRESAVEMFAPKPGAFTLLKRTWTLEDWQARDKAQYLHSLRRSAGAAPR